VTTNLHTGPTLRDYGTILVLVAIWGSAFLFIRLALASFPPATMVFLRLSCGALCMLAVLFFNRHYLQSVSPKLLVFLFFMALLGNALPFYSIGWGQQFVSSGIAGLLMAFVPLSTLFLAHFFLPDEKITTRKLCGFFLGFIGVGVLMAPQIQSSESNFQLYGMLAILLGALGYSASNILAKRRPASNDMFTTAMVLSLACMMMLPVSLNTSDTWTYTPITILSVIAILFLGVLGAAYATYLYFKVLRSAGASFVSQMNYLIPIWALIVGAIFLDETITVNAVISLVLILLGIFIAQTRPKVTSQAGQ